MYVGGYIINLLKSAHKNKSSVFNGLQAKMTDSNPVALTTFPDLDSGSKYNDLANKSLKSLPNFKHQSLKRTYLIPNTFLKNRSKLPPKSIKVSCENFKGL